MDVNTGRQAVSTLLLGRGCRKGGLGILLLGWRGRNRGLVYCYWECRYGVKFIVIRAEM